LNPVRAHVEDHPTKFHEFGKVFIQVGSFITPEE